MLLTHGKSIIKCTLDKSGITRPLIYIQRKSTRGLGKRRRRIKVSWKEISCTSPVQFFLEGCHVIKVLQGTQCVEVIEAVCITLRVCVSPVVQQSLEILEQSVFVLINEAHHWVPVKRGRQVNACVHTHLHTLLLCSHSAYCPSTWLRWPWPKSNSESPWNYLHSVATLLGTTF